MNAKGLYWNLHPFTWPRAASATKFVREYGLTYPQLKDPDDQVRSDYGVAGVPETIVIDPRGRVAAVKRGPVDDEFMRQQVAPLVERESS